MWWVKYKLEQTNTAIEVWAETRHLEKGSWSATKTHTSRPYYRMICNIEIAKMIMLSVKLTLLGGGPNSICRCFIFRISLIHYCIFHNHQSDISEKNLQYFEMIFVVILWKPNVLPGVRVCQTSMVNNLISKEEACCGRATPGVCPTLSHGKSHPSMVPLVPSVHWYHPLVWLMLRTEGDYKKLSALEIHIWCEETLDV